ARAPFSSDVPWLTASPNSIRPPIISTVTGKMRANSVATFPDRSRSRRRQKGMRQWGVWFMIDASLRQGDLHREIDVDALVRAVVHLKTGVAGERYGITDDDRAGGRQGVVARPLALVLREVHGAVQDSASAPADAC